jgi:membrane associated rhomboid family serine protease
MSSSCSTAGSESRRDPDFFGLVTAVVVFVAGMTVGSGGIIAHIVGSIVGAIVAFFLSRYLITLSRNRQ